MTAEMLERFLNSLSISVGINGETDWERIESLHQIAFNMDGNQEYSEFNDRIKFDVTNNLIKIKKYFPKLISIPFNKNAQAANGKLIVQGNLGIFFSKINGISLELVRERKKSLKIGDILFLVVNGKVVSGETGVVDSIMIVNNEMKVEYTGSLDTSTFIPGTFSIYAADGETYSDSFSDSRNEGILIKQTPQTNNPVDIYLDADEISAFILKEYTAW